MEDQLVQRVAAYRDRHAMAGAGGTLAMVSGGADSVCLMHVLAEIASERIGVLAVDHGLRPEATREADDVAAAAVRLDLPVWVERLGLAAGPALQERARDGRLAAARRVARQHGFDRIATGHTASDQAETVLFRIARGTGRTGALGMGPVDGDLARPLLCATSGETRAWCRARGLAVVDDPANADARFARARVRHGLLPALRDVHPGAEHAVVRFAEHLRDEAEVLQVVVDEAWTRCARADGVAVAPLGCEHPAIARLLVRRLLAQAGLSGDATWIARCVELARSGGPAMQVPGGRIVVERGVLVAEGAAPEPPPDVVLEVPGQVRFGGRLIRAMHAAAVDPSATRVALRIDGPFTVRSPRPGDRLPMAGGGRQGVGRLLAAAGVAARHRQHVPVIAVGDRVVWIGGYRADPTLLAPRESRATVLEVTGA